MVSSGAAVNSLTLPARSGAAEERDPQGAAWRPRFQAVPSWLRSVLVLLAQFLTNPLSF